MNTPDERILHLIAILKTQKKITTMSQFCDEIGVLRQTIYKIKNGNAGFTVQHINMICKKYNANANWIFGIENKVFNTANSIEIKGFN